MSAADEPATQPCPDEAEHPEPWQTLTTEVALSNAPWFRVRRDRVRIHTGLEVTYTYMDRPDVVLVVPVSAAGELLLLRQYRYPVRAWCWEVPAGSVEPHEDPATAAARELSEELGSTCRSMTHIASLYLSPGTISGRSHIYLATGVELGESHTEATELLRAVRLPLAEGLRMARTGEITDGLSVLPLLLCEPLLRSARIPPEAGGQL